MLQPQLNVPRFFS